MPSEALIRRGSDALPSPWSGSMGDGQATISGGSSFGWKLTLRGGCWSSLRLGTTTRTLKGGFMSTALAPAEVFPPGEYLRDELEERVERE
jgi:hypothetical protein